MFFRVVGHKAEKSTQLSIAFFCSLSSTRVVHCASKALDPDEEEEM